TASGLTISVTEDAAFSGAVATFTDADPNGAIGDFTAQIDWGDGATTGCVIAAGAGGVFTVSGSHTYAEEAIHAVAVVISDVGGSQATANGVANVADASLTASGLTISATEGAAFSGAVATFTDANPNGAIG